jgi:hypothetical protein
LVLVQVQGLSGLTALLGPGLVDLDVFDLLDHLVLLCLHFAQLTHEILKHRFFVVTQLLIHI